MNTSYSMLLNKYVFRKNSNLSHVFLKVAALKCVDLVNQKVCDGHCFL